MHTLIINFNLHELARFDAGLYLGLYRMCIVCTFELK